MFIVVVECYNGDYNAHVPDSYHQTTAGAKKYIEDSERKYTINQTRRNLLWEEIAAWEKLNPKPKEIKEAADAKPKWFEGKDQKLHQAEIDVWKRDIVSPAYVLEKEWEELRSSYINNVKIVLDKQELNPEVDESYKNQYSIHIVEVLP